MLNYQRVYNAMYIYIYNAIYGYSIGEYQDQRSNFWYPMFGQALLTIPEIMGFLLLPTNPCLTD